MAKCQFMMEKVIYCGQCISRDGVQPVKEKVEAISKAPEPKNVSQLKSFLGMLNFYHRYLPKVATVLAPLHQLLQKGVQWSWGAKQKKAFAESKKLLLSADLLIHYDASKPLVLACDASPYGLGAVLSHKMEDGSERPIAFMSRSLNAAEKNYAQIDKEGLAVVFGVTRFHQYLYGQKFVIYTDHKPLLGLFSENKSVPPMAAARIQRWALTLSAYEYIIVHREGRLNGNADALSRLPLPEQPKDTPVPGETIMLMEHMDSVTITVKEIQHWSRRDPVISQAIHATQQGWFDQCPSETLRPYWLKRMELSVQDGCLLWGNRVVVPPQGRKPILVELHETHPGIVRMKALARSYVWWPGMDNDLEKTVYNCPECQETQKKPKGVYMHPWEYPQHPWRRLHIDCAGPFLGKTFLIVVDAYSKWIEAIAVNNATSATTIEKLRMVFATHGLPDVLVSDNGTCFTSEEFGEFLRRNGIRHRTSAPYHPSSNGLAERAVQTVKSGLIKMKGDTVETRLSRFLFKYRVTPQSVTGLSPAEMLMNRRPRSALDRLYPDMGGKVMHCQERQKETHDRHVGARRCMVGDSVYVTNFGRGPKWLPGTALQSSDTMTEVLLSDGRVVRRHMDHLRPCKGVPPAVIQPPAVPAAEQEVRVVVPPSGVPNKSIQSNEMALQSAQEEVAPQGETEAVVVQSSAGLRSSGRERHSPTYLNDYVT